MMASASLDRELKGCEQRNWTQLMTGRCRYYKKLSDGGHNLSSFNNLLLIDGFHELADNQRYALYSLDLFLGSHQLPFETPNRLLTPRNVATKNRGHSTFVHP